MIQCSCLKRSSQLLLFLRCQRESLAPFWSTPVLLPSHPAECVWGLSLQADKGHIFLFGGPAVGWSAVVLHCLVSVTVEREKATRGWGKEEGREGGCTPCFFSAPMFPLAVFVAQHYTMGAFVCWGVEAEAILFQSFLEVLCLRCGGGLMLSCGCLLFPLSPFIQSFSVFSISPSLLLHLSLSLYVASQLSASSLP